MPRPSTFSRTRLASSLAILAAIFAPASMFAGEKTATLKLERRDQLPLNAAHRHTIWINGQNVGLISNGATKTYEFTPKAGGKNVIYIEAYDPFVKDPESNRVETRRSLQGPQWPARSSGCRTALLSIWCSRPR